MCTEITFATGRNPIVSVGGPNGFGNSWRLPVAEVKRLINTGLWSFFVNQPTPTPPDRVAVRVNAGGFLTTVPDGEPENNLTALPQQAASVPESPPTFPADLPPARKPTFDSIKTTSNAQFVKAPDPDGLFHILPANQIALRMEAPFTNDFEVRVNGDLLPRASGASGGPLPAGHWYIPNLG